MTRPEGAKKIEFSDLAVRRLVHDMNWWRTVLIIDRAWLWVCIERHEWRQWRGLITLFPDSRCWGFSWGNHERVPLPDETP